MAAELIGNIKPGLLFVVSAPAGTGKTTLVKMLVEKFPQIVRSVSHTTRKPRPGETQGCDYFFIQEAEFKEMIRAEKFLEYVKLYDTYYGTSKLWVEEQLKRGKHVLLVIDTQGGLALKNKMQATYIFIMPPSLDVLRERLTKRKTEISSAIEERLNWAAKEMDEGRRYDYQIVNDDLGTAYQVLQSIIVAETHRVSHVSQQNK